MGQNILFLSHGEVVQWERHKKLYLKFLSSETILKGFTWKGTWSRDTRVFPLRAQRDFSNFLASRNPLHVLILLQYLVLPVIVHVIQWQVFDHSVHFLPSNSPNLHWAKLQMLNIIITKV